MKASRQAGRQEVCHECGTEACCGLQERLAKVSEALENESTYSQDLGQKVVQADQLGKERGETAQRLQQQVGGCQGLGFEGTMWGLP